MSKASDLTGVIIAEKYELLRLIDIGGMGAVYEARALATLKRCAVKLLLKPELAGDAEVLRRFFREARASGLIQSQHVVTAFDSGIDQTGWPYYVMEYLVGEDLRHTLSSLGPLNQAAATKIVYQAALGLAKAHELGIVHRDVKPANLFLVLADDGEIKVKVLDFGVAKVKMEVFHETTLSVTRTGSILGTPLYMSPEQVRRASSIDASADVWSLGVLLFECLTGELPWGQVDGFGELIAAILTNELPMVQDFAPWVKPELAEIVHRAISRDLSYRFRTAGELCEALKALVSHGAHIIQSDVAPPPDSERGSVAPRLSLADTVMMQPTMAPSQPSPSDGSGARRKVIRVASAMLLAAVMVGSATWRMRGPGLESSAVAHTSSVPKAMVAPSAPPVPSAVPAPSDTAPATEPVHAALEIIPRSAQVTVDGAPVAVVQGKAYFEGELGSTHVVDLSIAGTLSETQVALTANGPLPARIELKLPRKKMTKAPALEPPTNAAPPDPSPPTTDPLDPIFH